MATELNPRQKAFCDHYLKTGNATQSYLKAGYKVSDKVAASNGERLLRNADIKKYLEQRQAKVETKRILSIEECQAFLAKVVMGTEERRADQIKAAELLIKVQGGFIEHVDLKGQMQFDGGEMSEILEELKKKR